MKYLQLLTIVTLSACYSRAPEKTGLEGKPIPSFSILLSDSVTVFNTADIPKGQPTVLFYFGPRCPYSLTQMEEIIDEMDILNNIEIYAFTSSKFEEMKNFSQKYRLSKYHNIKVGIDHSLFFADYFKAPGVPYLAIYGKDKKLNKVFIGKVYAKQILKAALD